MAWQLARVKETDKQRYNKIQFTGGFDPRLPCERVTDTKIEIQQTILAWENASARKYLGKIQWLDCETHETVVSGWYAQPTVGQRIRLDGKDHPYGMFAFSVPEGRSIESYLAECTIPETPLHADEKVRKHSAQYLMKVILEYQRHVKLKHG